MDIVQQLYSLTDGHTYGHCTTVTAVKTSGRKNCKELYKTKQKTYIYT